MKHFLINLVFLLLVSNSYAAEELVHLKEGLSESEARELIQNMNHDEVRNGVENQFPKIKEHPAEFGVEILIFTSSITGKTRPVYRIRFETIDDLELEFTLAKQADLIVFIEEVICSNRTTFCSTGIS